MSLAYTCGVDEKRCSGSKMTASQGLRNFLKIHGSPEEAFKCKARDLVANEGYTQIGPREFSPKDGGPILVLTKKSKFGGILRRGKRGTETGSTNRVMPKKRGGGFIVG